MGNTARTKVKLSPEAAPARLIAAARGNARQLHLAETKQPQDAILLRRKGGSPAVVLAVPSGGVGETEALVAAQPVTVRGTLVVHNMYHLVTAQGVSAPLKVERHRVAPRLLVRQRVEVKGTTSKAEFFKV